MKFLPNLLLFHQNFGIYLTFLVLAHDHPGYKAKVQSHYESIQMVAQVLPKYHLKFCYSKKSIFSTNRKDRPLNVCLNLWYWLETSLYLHHWNNPENFHFEDKIFLLGFLFGWCIIPGCAVVRRWHAQHTVAIHTHHTRLRCGAPMSCMYMFWF